MLNEVDSAIPAYKEARQTYAGRQALYNAADLGEQALKPKTMVRDILDQIQNMSEQEKYFYKLGVKRALQDQIESESLNKDIAAKLFNRGGSIAKLKVLFDDPEAYETFRQNLENEANYKITQNIVQGNSTTFKQFKQDEGLNNSLVEIAMDFEKSEVGKLKGVAQTVMNLVKPSDEKIFREAKIEAAKFLTTEGIDPKRVDALLESGREKELKQLLMRTMQKTNKAQKVVPIVGGATTITSEEQE
jgi:hypothetical protein